MLDKDLIADRIGKLIDPLTDTTLKDSGSVGEIGLTDDGKVLINIIFTYANKSQWGHWKARIVDALADLDEMTALTVDIEIRVATHRVQDKLSPIPGVRNVVAVASGKGGVGKSTTTANLALALAAEGASVGILDADIHGPSQPRMMGLSGRPDVEEEAIIPKTNHGVQTMSIGYMVEEDTPMIWRGPMVTQALQQLLNETAWDRLDYLLIDMPPGTGDIALTLAQQVPVSGAVIVTTPQDIALLDARKALNMFERVKVPVLGIVENMSTHICSSCGHEESIFGAGGGQSMATQYGVEMLGALPLTMSIREQADGGTPTVAADPDGQIADIYREIARKMAAGLSNQARNAKVEFPKIVIQNT